jgi:hypothetical protein
MRTAAQLYSVQCTHHTLYTANESLRVARGRGTLACERGVGRVPIRVVNVITTPS